VDTGRTERRVHASIAVVMKSEVVWVVVRREPNVSEEHIASTFRVQVQKQAASTALQSLHISSLCGSRTQRFITVIRGTSKQDCITELVHLH
jgi:hypothetical protein